MEKKYELQYFNKELNNNDAKLIFLCREEPKSVGVLSRELELAPINIMKRLPKLEEKNMIIINRLGKGKKTLITSNILNREVNEIIKDMQTITEINEALKTDSNLRAIHEGLNKFEKKVKKAINK